MTWRPTLGETIEVAEGIEIVEVKPYPLPLELRNSVGSLDEAGLDRAFYQAAFKLHPPESWPVGGSDAAEGGRPVVVPAQHRAIQWLLSGSLDPALQDPLCYGADADHRWAQHLVS